MSSFVALATSAPVVKRAAKVGLLVGTVLAIINHGNALLESSFGLGNAIQVLLTYLVPYSVSTYSSVSAMREFGVTSNPGSAGLPPADKAPQETQRPPPPS